MFTAFSIRENAQHLEELLFRNLLPLPSGVEKINSGILPEPEVMNALQSWTVGKGAHILWIDGLDGDKQRTSFTDLAETIVSNAQEFRVGALYFSCDSYAEEYVEARNDEEKNQQCLLDLVNVFIWQLVQSLPKGLNFGGDFSTTRFETCGRDYNNLAGSVEILEELLDISPNLSIIVIDGIENLSHPGVERDVKYILEMIFLHCEDVQGNSQVQKDSEGKISGTGNGIRMLLSTVNPSQPLTELYEQYESEVTHIPVSWKRWHQYGLDMALFENEL